MPVPITNVELPSAKVIEVLVQEGLNVENIVYTKMCGCSRVLTQEVKVEQTK